MIYGVLLEVNFAKFDVQDSTFYIFQERLRKKEELEKKFREKRKQMEARSIIGLKIYEKNVKTSTRIQNSALYLKFYFCCDIDLLAVIYHDLPPFQ